MEWNIEAPKAIAEDVAQTLYNCMIKDGKKIKVNLIDKSEVIFCGTPEEYEKYTRTLFTNE